MKFDDAVQIIDGITMISGDFGVSPDVAKRIIEDLREEYEPTIEMTKFEKDTLLKYIFGDEGNFFDLIEYETDYLYRKLSTSELMQAWLHPETIKVVNDEKD